MGCHGVCMFANRCCYAPMARFRLAPQATPVSCWPLQASETLLPLAAGGDSWDQSTHRLSHFVGTLACVVLWGLSNSVYKVLQVQGGKAQAGRTARSSLWQDLRTGKGVWRREWSRRSWRREIRDYFMEAVAFRITLSQKSRGRWGRKPQRGCVDMSVQTASWWAPMQAIY